MLMNKHCVLSLRDCRRAMGLIQITPFCKGSILRRNIMLCLAGCCLVSKKAIPPPPTAFCNWLVLKKKPHSVIALGLLWLRGIKTMKRLPREQSGLIYDWLHWNGKLSQTHACVHTLTHTVLFSMFLYFVWSTSVDHTAATFTQVWSIYSSV